MLRNEAALELAKERLADATVRAPSRGTIIAKTVEEGQIIASSTNNVSGGTVMLQMADLSELEIRTLVDEIDIGSVEPGLRVESTVEAFADMRFEGAVIKIEPQAVVQQSVTTFPVLSRIDNSQGLLLPGMNADVSIIIHERPGVLTVPNEAVRSLADGEEVIRLLSLPALPQDARVTLAADVESTPAAHRPVAAVAPGGNGDNGDNGHADNGDNGLTDNGDNGHAAGPVPAVARGAETPDERDARGTDGTRRDAGVVFVLGPDGTITPREVVTGIRDWERAEVLAGLEGDELLVLLPSTSLLRSQQSMRERFARRNAVVPGAGR
jgi:HlyD family secretion protein